MKQSRIRLADLTEDTIGIKTKSGDTPLHRAAKNGQLAQIPAHLLKLDLFFERNIRQETPLHYAAKHGTLNQVPPQFLTPESMTVPDYCGRTPLHVATSYRNFDQIPMEFHSLEYLTLKTSGYSGDTLFHLGAMTNTLYQFPQEFLTSENLQLPNNQGQIPIMLLIAHMPTAGQNLRLDAIGYPLNRQALTKELADTIIHEHEEKHKVYAPNLPLGKDETDSPVHLSYVKGDAGGLKESWKVTLLAKSSSRPEPYEVQFLVLGENLLGICNCLGGRNYLCKHIIALINGEATMLYDTKQEPQYANLQTIPQFKSLQRRIANFLREVNSLERLIEIEEERFYQWYNDYCRDNSPKDKITVQVSETFNVELSISQSLYIADFKDAPLVQEKMKAMKEKTGILKAQRRELKSLLLHELHFGFS